MKENLLRFRKFTKKSLEKLTIVSEKSLEKLTIVSEKTYNLIINNLKWFIIFSLILSVLYGIIKTVFFNGYSVDSYQIYALSIKNLILTGKQDYLFREFYARNRILYPLIIAIVNIIIPIDISILACIINLLFALLTLLIIRKIMKLLNFQNQTINLSSLFLILSYNFLNYLFVNVTDFTSLFFLLITIYYLIRFINERKYFDLAFCSVFFVYAVLARESNLIFIVLFLFAIKSSKIRLVISGLLIVLMVLILAFIPEYLPFQTLWLAPSLRDYFLNKQYGQILLLIFEKWKSFRFFLQFIKGLFKVGILTSVFALIILDQTTVKSFFKSFKSKQPNIFVYFFIIYWIFYTVLYSHPSSATGLRYWLPISWIPPIFLAKFILRSKRNINIKSILLLIFILTPISWSIGELYVNRISPSGTGPLLEQGYYFNDMSNTRTISFYDPSQISIRTINKTYLNATLLNDNFDINPLALITRSFSISLWLDITKNSTLVFKMRSSNATSSTWGIELYMAQKNFYPGFGDLMYSVYNEHTQEYFSIITLSINEFFLLRKIQFILSGIAGDQFFFDFLLIEAS